MSEEIKFPFEPSQAVKDAFVKANKRRVAARVLVEQILESLSEDEMGFELLRKEHPEIRNVEFDLLYNYKAERIEKRK